MKHSDTKTRTTHQGAGIGTLFLFIFIASGILNAQSGQASFVPFNDFVQGTRVATSSDYLTHTAIKVKDAQAFEEMRQHILSLYDGVSVSHSFVLDGDHFDCVPIEQQPGVRMRGLKSIATPPPSPAFFKAAQTSNDHGKRAEEPVGISSQLSAEEQFDEYGNSRICEENTIPMRRVTLQDTSRFATLKNFLEKGPAGSGQPPSMNVENASGTVLHKYSYTLDYVNNLGQTDTINLWSPHVNTSLGEIFSLAQSWTIGYTPVDQTAEVGWQNYPAQYGGQNSRLFIYWTADGYNKTGCYNLTCAGFVQTASGWTFGGGFSHYSKVGGTQYEFRAEYQLFGGNWWLGLGTADSITWVGYYPASLYGSGPMSTKSQLIEFGSESVGSNPWPPEGSGKWASAGFKQAGYQRELFYLSYPSATATWDSLTVEQPSPNCYSIAGPYNGGYNPPSNDWGIYIYFGGPGGKNCK
jgi:Neprosin